MIAVKSPIASRHNDEARKEIASFLRDNGAKATKEKYGLTKLQCRDIRNEALVNALIARVNAIQELRLTETAQDKEQAAIAKAAQAVKKTVKTVKVASKPSPAKTPAVKKTLSKIPTKKVVKAPAEEPLNLL